MCGEGKQSYRDIREKPKLTNDNGIWTVERGSTKVAYIGYTQLEVLEAEKEREEHSLKK